MSSTNVLSRFSLGVAALLSAGIAAVLVAGGGGSATAAEAPPAILVSADGVHFSTTLSTGLFDGLGALIPGGSQSATLWVQNPTSATVVVRLSARDFTVSAPDFAASVAVAASKSGDPAATSRALSTLEACEVLIEPSVMAAGETIAMTLRFTLADVTAQVAQGEHAGLNLLVGMRDEAAGAFPDSACDDHGVVIGPEPESTAAGSGGPLAHTGSDGATPLWIVAGLIGGGLFFLILGYRRRLAYR